MAKKSKHSRDLAVSRPSRGSGDISQKETMPVPIVDCPPELGAAAHREWDRIIGHLAKTGALSHFDRGPLALYCAAYGHWIEATEPLQKHSSVMKSPSGYPVQSPYVAIANRQAEIMMRIASEFGFTPASRGRLWLMSSSDLKLLELPSVDDINSVVQEQG